MNSCKVTKSPMPWLRGPVPTQFIKTNGIHANFKLKKRRRDGRTRTDIREKGESLLQALAQSQSIGERCLEPRRASEAVQY